VKFREGLWILTMVGISNPLGATKKFDEINHGSFSLSLVYGWVSSDLSKPL
jgi:hypothetical protein